MPYDGDVIVVGGGAGGATFAYACARAGNSVLLLERGARPVPEDAVHDERATLMDKQPYDDRTVAVNDRPRRLYMGGLLGGGTTLYGVSSSTGVELHAVAAIAMHAYSVAVMDLRMTPGGRGPGRPGLFLCRHGI